MNRKDFLMQAGLGTAALFAINSLVSCSKTNAAVASGNVDFTLDIASPSYAALNNNGGFVYVNGVIVAKTTTGNFIAVSQSCTHQGATVQYRSAQDDFYCPEHGSVFADNGAVVGGPAPTALRQYNTTLTGTSLRVYS